LEFKSGYKIHALERPFRCRFFIGEKPTMKPFPYILAAISLLLAPGLISADQRHVRILIQLSLPNTPVVSVVLSRNEIVVQPGDLFEISMMVENRSGQRVNARIDHVIEPRAGANHLDFVECGFLTPITLHPGIANEYFARYLLRADTPVDVRQLSLTYDFKLRRVIGSQ
jgi:cytochrome c oxidase assembly protein Cox11